MSGFKVLICSTRFGFNKGSSTWFLLVSQGYTKEGPNIIATLLPDWIHRGKENILRFGIVECAKLEKAKLNSKCFWIMLIKSIYASSDCWQQGMRTSETGHGSYTSICMRLRCLQNCIKRKKNHTNVHCLASGTQEARLYREVSTNI